LEYRSRKAAKDAPVVTRMKELSAQYPRYAPLAAGEPARSPFFCGDFLYHLNLEIALRHQLLQPLGNDKAITRRGVVQLAAW
jgi:hypothetical protein